MRASAIAISLILGLAAPTSSSAQRSDDDESALLVSDARKRITAQDYDRAAAELDRALALNPRRLDAYILRASVHAVKKEYEAGVALMRRAQALAPENPDVLTALGTQLLLSGNAAEGVPVLEQVIAKNPDRYQAHATLGQHHAQTGDYRRAVTELEAYLASRPAALAAQDPAVTMTLADAQLRSGDAKGAERRFAGVVAADAKNTRAQIGRAWAAAAVDCATALPQLDRLLPLADKVPDVFLVKGWCALRTGKPAEARSLADRYIGKGKAAAAGYALRGEALLALGENNNARAALNEAVKRDPQKHAYIIKLARVERLIGDPTATVVRLKGMKPLPGDQPDWALETAEALLALNRAEEAMAELAPLADAHAKHPRYRLVYGTAQLRAGRPDPAVINLEEAVNLAPRDEGARDLLVEALRGSARTSVNVANFVAAERVLARALEIRPEHVGAARDLGIVRLASGRAAEAVEPLALAGRGKDALALQLLGRAQAILGRIEEARKSFEAALAAAAGNAARVSDIQLELASAELEAGEPARAVAALEPAMTKAPPVRTVDAYLSAARAAAEKAMISGNFYLASRLLLGAEKHAATPEMKLAVRCELALAATGAGERDVAVDRLRQLDRPGATCPFPSPADELAIPVLVALNAAGDARAMEAALDRLGALGRRATGPAQRLVDDAQRLLAIRAAAEAYARGQADRARRFLVVAARVRGAGIPELAYDQAVLDMDAGRIDEAIRVFERTAGEVPESLVALGVAYDRKGDPQKALEYYVRAAQSPTLRFPRVREWIAAKQRIYGSGGGEP